MKKTLTVKEIDEALSVLQVALTFDEALRTVSIILSERYNPAIQMAGLSLCLSVLQKEKYPDLFRITKSIPKALYAQFEKERENLANAIEVIALTPKGGVH